MSILRKFQTGGKLNTVKPDTIIHEGLVSKVPDGYSRERQEIVDGKIRTYHSIQRNEPKTNILPPINKILPAKPTSDPVAYDKMIRGKLASGIPVQKLVDDGIISIEAAKGYLPFEVKRDVYTEEDINKRPNNVLSNTVNNPTNKQAVLYGGANAYRRNVVEASTDKYKAYDFPDENGNYTNKANRKYAIGDRVIDLNKSYDSKGNFVPHYTGEVLPKEGLVNYSKPSDDNITKQNNGTINNFIQPGTTVNRNNFGGQGNNEKTIANSNNTKSFVPENYNIIEDKSKGKEVGKMYSAPSLKKGGVLGCKCGGMFYKKNKVSKKQDGGNMISKKQS